MPSSNLPCAAVLRHVVDVHCHPTEAALISPDSVNNLQIAICAMSTRQSDQPLVRKLAENYPKVVPCFGYHPWFTHWIALDHTSSREEHYRRLFLGSADADESGQFKQLLQFLPNPITLDQVLLDLRHNLEAFPNAMLGEVGLDRTFRVALDYFASPRELTRFTIPFHHQLAILEAQLDLAVQLGRNISFHSVKSQLGTMELLARMSKKYGDQWNKISIDMHSCGFSPQVWRDIEQKHPNVFLSLSTIINGRSPNYKSLIAACSPSRILVESDVDNVDYCVERTWEMLKTVAEIKGWHIEDHWDDTIGEAEWGAVRKLEENWKAFQCGNHSRHRRNKKGNDQDMDEEDEASDEMEVSSQNPGLS